jgi:hypothetical protein
MSAVKQQVLDVLVALPDDCTIDDVVSELELLSTFEQAEAAENAGRVFAPEEAIQRVKNSH